MHTASDPTRRSGNPTRWFRICGNILLYAHRARHDLRGANRVAFGVQRALIGYLDHLHHNLYFKSIVARKIDLEKKRRYSALVLSKARSIFLHDMPFSEPILIPGARNWTKSESLILVVISTG